MSTAVCWNAATVNSSRPRMRQTCLDEKPARAGKLPSISPALLRQLAGMGNNLNQIARRG